MFGSNRTSHPVAPPGFDLDWALRAVATLVDKRKSESLLSQHPPQQIIERLDEGEPVIAHRYAEVSVGFSHFHGFTAIHMRSLHSVSSGCRSGRVVLYGSAMYSTTARSLLLASGISAMVGAVMWAYKSLVILATGDQPDYWFELALFWFGVSILLLASALRHHVRRPRLVFILGWVSAIAGGAASLAYWLDGDDEGLFGPAAFVMMVSTVVFLFLVGGEVHKRRLLARHAAGPRLLGWLYLAGLAIGAVMSGLFGERYLEVGLLAVVAGWVVVAVGALNGLNESLDASA